MNILDQNIDSESVWETVEIDTTLNMMTARLKVPGGHLYKVVYPSTGVALEFVPDVDLTRYQAHLRDAYNQGMEDGKEQAANN